MAGLGELFWKGPLLKFEKTDGPLKPSTARLNQGHRGHKAPSVIGGLSYYVRIPQNGRLFGDSPISKTFSSYESCFPHPYFQ